MDKLKKIDKRRIQYTHGGYTFLTTGEVPEHRQYIKKYLTDVREGTIKDIGPTEKDLTTAQLLISKASQG